MSQTTAVSKDEDDWGTSGNRRGPSNGPVPDDWEADDDSADYHRQLPTIGSARQLWDEANARQPQPQIALASSGSSLSQTQLSGSIGNAQRTILKRPTSGASSTSSQSKETQKSLQEREASYQAARNRIFGGNGPEEGRPAPGPAAVSNVIRTPRGPPESVSSPVAADAMATAPKSGFAGRVRRQGHGRTISDLENIGDFVKNRAGATST